LVEQGVQHDVAAAQQHRLGEALLDSADGGEVDVFGAGQGAELLGDVQEAAGAGGPQ
jgi:hypothetical protein